MDVDGQGQQARVNMSEKIAPVVLDKDGNPKAATQAAPKFQRN